LHANEQLLPLSVISVAVHPHLPLVTVVFGMPLHDVASQVGSWPPGACDPHVPLRHSASPFFAYPLLHVRLHTDPLFMFVHESYFPPVGLSGGTAHDGSPHVGITQLPFRHCAVETPVGVYGGLHTTAHVVPLDADVGQFGNAPLLVVGAAVHAFGWQMAFVMSHLPYVHTASPTLVYPLVHVNAQVAPCASLAQLAN
jgi:hypothetical protein